MNITIIGAGNMGGAIACGLASCNSIDASLITVVDRAGDNVDRLKAIYPQLNVIVADYASVAISDIVILAVKPWGIQEAIYNYINPNAKKQILVSVAASISLTDMQEWSNHKLPVYRVIPNTAINVKESMTFVATQDDKIENIETVKKLFSKLGKVELIDEKLMTAGTSLASCGIAFAFRYIRAAMEGGVELGFRAGMSKEIVLQTLKGAVALLEANGTHPEEEIDKVTTAGGITIKGLNEMEHAGFSSAVIKGLKASNVE